MYTKSNTHCEILVLCLYVDDLLFTGNNERLFMEFKQTMFDEFEMTDNGLMSFFLGIEIRQDQNGIFLCQQKFTEELLEKFKMNNCNIVTTPVAADLHLTKEGDGRLVESTQKFDWEPQISNGDKLRPDIVYGVGLLSRYMEMPRESHWQAAKRVLRYVKGILYFGLFYAYGENSKLMGYSNSDWGRDPEERKSTIGYVFYFGSTAFTWTSKK